MTGKQDIINRLRDASSDLDADMTASIADLLNEAADEITKIRREVEELRGGLTDAGRRAVEKSLHNYPCRRGDKR